MTGPITSRVTPLQRGLPAVLGGAALFAEPCVVNRPVAPERGAFLASIDSILSSRRFTNDGPIVRRFEQQIAERCGVEHVVACANGTLALELLARVHRLRGEIVVPAFTFVATAHAFRSNGLTPVFCDVDLDSMNMDPASCQAALSERTSAICAVHLWGRAAPVQALTMIAGEANARLYFDAAHAFGCTLEGRPVGGFGAAEVFSFHATKILHTMEGGGITTNDEALARELRLVRNFGFSNYDQVDRLGTNAKMHEMRDVGNQGCACACSARSLGCDFPGAAFPPMPIEPVRFIVLSRGRTGGQPLGLPDFSHIDLLRPTRDSTHCRVMQAEVIANF